MVASTSLLLCVVSSSLFIDILCNFNSVLDFVQYTLLFTYHLLLKVAYATVLMCVSDRRICFLCLCRSR